ncbi:MAG: hypothetical protein V4488_16740 [Pseudomonadota bacterium]
MTLQLRNELPSSILSFIVRTFIAGGIGLVAFIFVLFALHPYAPLTTQINFAFSDCLIALPIALAIFLVVLWRLVRGATIRDEFRKLMNAISSDDHLE